MSPETKDRISKACGLLKIQDIVLFECRLIRPERDPEKLARTVIQQHKREVRYFLHKDPPRPEDIGALQVLVSLGTRMVPPATDDDADPAAFFVVEADFLAVYGMAGELDDDCLRAFADHNAIHNVWPFWRHHVFDMVARGMLPPFEIPLYSGIVE